jgi:hypothetical protein
MGHDAPKYHWDTEESRAKFKIICDQERAERAKRTKYKLVAFVVAGITISLLVWANTPTPEEAAKAAEHAARIEREVEEFDKVSQACGRLYGNGDERGKARRSCEYACLDKPSDNRFVRCIKACGYKEDEFGNCIQRGMSRYFNQQTY